MSSEQLEYWRKTLSESTITEILRFIHDLAPRPVPERALKTREKFKALAPDLLRLLLETARCREELGGAFPWASNAFFLQSSVEQSTRPEIAHHHARQFSGKRVLEIGCGIGFDTAALSSAAEHVLAIDSDALCCAVAEHNLAAQGISNVTVRHSTLADLHGEITLSDFNALWADPARRNSSGQRLYDPEQYSPPLSSVTGMEFSGLIGIKISPALNVILPDDQWKREFIGWEWACPEQLLWKSGSQLQDQATLADRALTWSRRSDRSCSARAELLSEGNILIEPHPALVRTGDLELFYAEHGLFQLDPQMALGLSAATSAPSAWYREFRIVETFRFTLKSLKERLGALGWDSRTQIKKRGVQDDPDQIHRSLKLPAPRSDSPWGFVILTKIDNSPQAILAHRI